MFVQGISHRKLFSVSIASMMLDSHLFWLSTRLLSLLSRFQSKITFCQAKKEKVQRRKSLAMPLISFFLAGERRVLWFFCSHFYLLSMFLIFALIILHRVGRTKKKKVIYLNFDVAHFSCPFSSSRTRYGSCENGYLIINTILIWSKVTIVR